MEKMSEINGIPAEKQWAFFGVKPLRIDLRLSEYDIRHESTILLAIRTPGGSEQTPAKVLDDTVELSDAPDMITWNDDPENKRAKMPCGHAISKELLFLMPLEVAGFDHFLKWSTLPGTHRVQSVLMTGVAL